MQPYRYRRQPMSPGGERSGDERAFRRMRAITSRVRVHHLLVAVDVVLLVVYALWYSPLLEIEAVEIIGTDHVPKASLQELVEAQSGTSALGIIPQTNLLAFSTGAFASRVSERYDFEELSIRKKFPHTLTIDVREKSPFALFYSGQNVYVVEKNGFIAGLVGTGDVPQEGLQKISEEVALGIPKVGDQLISSETVTFMQDFPLKLSGDTGLTFSDWIIPSRDSQRLHARMVDGWYIVFQMQKNFGDQYGNFLAVWREKLDDTPPSEYVDVRILDRVFFK